MKKRLLLGILPALMVLSACNGAGAKVEEPQLYLETTESNGLFGREEAAGELKARRNSEAGVLLEPKIGVQFKVMAEDDPATTEIREDRYAIRFIGAIASLKVKATWTRGLTKLNGNVSKDLTGGFESKIAYTSLKRYNETTEKMESITAEDFAGDGYKFFVIYSMYNIPAEELSSYMVAYLTLEDDAATGSVTSKAKISQINSLGTVFTAPSNATYFVGGDFADEAIVADETTILGEVNNASFDCTFAANDTFNIFKLDSAFNVYGSSKISGVDGATRFSNYGADTGKIKVTTAGTYNLYLRKETNKIYSSDKRFYLVGSMNEWQHRVGYEFYESATDGEYVLPNSIAINKWGKMKVHDTSDGWYGGSDKEVIVKGDYQIHFFPKEAGSGDYDWSADKRFYVDLLEETPVTFTWTAPNVWEDNAVVYARAWGGVGYTDTWLPVTKISNTSVSVLLGEATGLFFARFAEGTELPTEWVDTFTQRTPNADMGNFTAEWPLFGIRDVYFTNNKGWTTPNAYYWHDSPRVNPVGWPGVEMTYVGKNSENEDFYSVTINFDLYDRIIFNGSGRQTGDIDISNIYQNGFYISNYPDSGDCSVEQWNYVPSAE
ncbi:MAG: starch-binding protein [Erysipelotrichaceae bacterium]|nr:starch-binding protein [Erysipelotrichaceae bacterium]